MSLLSSCAATSAARQRGGLLAALVVPNAASARCVESPAAATAVATAVVAASGEVGGTQQSVGAPSVASAQPGVRQQQQQLNQQLQQQHRNGLQQHQVPHTRKLAAAAGSRLTIEHQLKTVWSSSSWHQLPPLLPSLSCWRALHTTPAAAQQTAAASAPSQQQQQQEQQLLPPEIVSACEGPALLYRQGLESGMYRPDPLQQVTVQKLQSVFEALRAVHPAPRKQSGLTMVDSVGSAKKEQASWWVDCEGEGGGDGWG